MSETPRQAGLRRAREERIAARSRNEPRWKNPPVRIADWECIACDACQRECPAHFGAIFNHGVDVKVIPELCSGCNRCIRVCPVDCIYPHPEWEPTQDEALWSYPGTGADPFVHPREFQLR